MWVVSYYYIIMRPLADSRKAERGLRTALFFPPFSFYLYEDIVKFLSVPPTDVSVKVWEP